MSKPGAELLRTMLARNHRLAELTLEPSFPLNRFETLQRWQLARLMRTFDDLYRLRRLPEGLEFELFIDERRIELENDPERLSDPNDRRSAGTDQYAPHLFVFASGESTVFEIHIVRSALDRRVVLRGDVLGELEFGVDEV